jgi:hypothetical protein
MFCVHFMAYYYYDIIRLRTRRSRNFDWRPALIASGQIPSFCPNLDSRNVCTPAPRRHKERDGLSYHLGRRGGFCAGLAFWAPAKAILSTHGYKQSLLI